MTGLLVSIRNLEEAKTVAAEAIAILDIKEPSYGALGMANIDTIDEIARFVEQLPKNRPLLSVAMGELKQFQGPELRKLPPFVGFVKYGLSELGMNNRWRESWRQLLENLPRHLEAVGVGYADYLRCSAPHPQQVLDACATTGTQYFLIDTFDKTHGCLFDALSEKEVKDLVDDGRDRNVKVVLAGSLVGKSLDRALYIGPNYVGVRGAICVGDRTSTISVDKLRNVLTQINSNVINTVL